MAKVANAFELAPLYFGYTKTKRPAASKCLAHDKFLPACSMRSI